MRIHERIQTIGPGNSGFSITHPDDCTIYLLETGAGCAVIDAGCGIQTELIIQELAAVGHQPEDVKSILLTHGHGDHAGGVTELSERCRADVRALPGIARYVIEGDEKSLSVDKAIEAGMYDKDFHIRPCPVIPLPDGQTLQIDGSEIRARLMEGHCSGHGRCEVQLGGQTVIFSGDSVFCGGKISIQAIWDRGLQKYIETCQILERLYPDVLLPSHGRIALNRGRKQIEMAVRKIRELKLPENLEQIDYKCWSSMIIFGLKVIVDTFSPGLFIIAHSVDELSFYHTQWSKPILIQSLTLVAFSIV